MWGEGERWGEEGARPGEREGWMVELRIRREGGGRKGRRGGWGRDKGREEGWCLIIVNTTSVSTLLHSLHVMLECREVKGEAMEASPRRTNCGSIDASSSFFMRSRNFFCQRRGEKRGEREWKRRGEWRRRGEGSGRRERERRRRGKREWKRIESREEDLRKAIKHARFVYAYCSIT